MPVFCAIFTFSTLFALLCEIKIGIYTYFRPDENLYLCAQYNKIKQFSVWANISIC